MKKKIIHLALIMFRRRIMYFVLHFCVEKWHIGLVSYIDISDTGISGGWLGSGEASSAGASYYLCL